MQTRVFYCPQTFLSLDFQSKNDVSESENTFWDREELLEHSWSGHDSQYLCCDGPHER